MPVFSFRKDEILRKKKRIERLFAEGHSFFIYPFKIQYHVVSPEGTSPVQVMFSVGKRSFRLAVDRNRIRRQIREAYRLNKHILYESLEKHDKQIVLAIIFTAKTHIPYPDIEIKIKAVVKRLLKETERDAEHSADFFV